MARVVEGQDVPVTKGVGIVAWACGEADVVESSE